jgi:DNA-binding CsgD family transcriptional regulator/tetratricopeptide (TPR) repeat protein
MPLGFAGVVVRAQLPTFGEGKLFERTAELATLAQATVRARAGSGAIVVVEGAPGLGKTALLATVCRQASSVGMRVLMARGAELERNLPFGVVRQLFEPTMRELSASDRAAIMEDAAALAKPIIDQQPQETDAGQNEFAGLHGLYWLCANLSDLGTVLVAVDDAHWVDLPSLRWLAYLAQRLEGLHVVLLLTTRPQEINSEELTIVTQAAAAVVMSLRPLSLESSAALVRLMLSGEAESEFYEACHAASGGNPFYLREIITAARAGDQASGTAHDVEQLVPASVSRSVLWRLGRLGADALVVAQALATLGDESELRHVARLAELTLERANQAADRLLAADLIRRERPLAFAHPVVRAAVYENMAPGARSSAHARASRMLAAEGAEPDRVAVHLLVTDPATDPWRVELLRKAAREALARSAPDTAASYLHRALAEPAPALVRPAVLSELGFAEARAGRPEAVDHLASAMDSLSDARERARVARVLGDVLVSEARVSEAVQALDRAIAGLAADSAREARDVSLRLEAQALGFCPLDAATLPSIGPRLTRLLRDAGSGRIHPLLLLHQAMHEIMVGKSAQRAAQLAHRSLQGGLLTEVLADPQFSHLIAYVLMIADLLDEALRLFEQARLDFQRRGTALGLAVASCWGAHAHYRQGSLAEAETDARAALTISLPARWHFTSAAALSVLLETLVERGDYASAEHALDMCPLPLDGMTGPLSMYLRSGRGCLRIAQGQIREGVTDVLAAGRATEEIGFSNPAFAPWRSTAALALVSLGDHEQANQLAYEELELARQFGAPRPIGIALRAAGLITSGTAGLNLLREAVSVLEASGARLELARALVDLGAGLRRAGRRQESREPLERGLDLAVRCHAGVLPQRAREELRVAGARPRRDLLTGVDALSASELRVAKMAATGMTNRQIAQALFVTTKTVETHLRHVYQKLDGTSRGDLAHALGTGNEG